MNKSHYAMCEVDHCRFCGLLIAVDTTTVSVAHELPVCEDFKREWQLMCTELGITAQDVSIDRVIAHAVASKGDA